MRRYHLLSINIFSTQLDLSSKAHKNIPISMSPRWFQTQLTVMINYHSSQHVLLDADINMKAFLLWSLLMNWEPAFNTGSVCKIKYQPYDLVCAIVRHPFSCEENENHGLILYVQLNYSLFPETCAQLHTHDLNYSDIWYFNIRIFICRCCSHLDIPWSKP